MQIMPASMRIIRVWLVLSCLASFQMMFSLRLTQTVLLKGRFTSVYPQKGTTTTKAGSMPELLYIPSALSVRRSNRVASIRDDEHMVSLLADHGHIVHCLDFPRGACSSIMLESNIADCLAHIAPTQTKVILVANELSCLDALRYVSSVTSNGLQGSQQIHGLVLIDPPPLHSVRTEYGRRQILRKYSSSDSRYYSQERLTTSINDLDTKSFPALPTVDLVLHTADGDVDIQELASRTQEEVDYYEQRLQRELYKRPVTAVRKNKHKQYYRKQLHHNAPKPCTGILRPTPDTPDDNTSQHEINNNILTLVESDVLQSTDVLGDTIPIFSVENMPVLVISTPYISARAMEGVDRMTHCATGPACSSMAFKSEADTYMDTEVYGGFDFTERISPLFDEADDWGITSARETAHMYSAYPVQVITPHVPVENLQQSVVKEDILDEDWSQLEIHTNADNFNDTFSTVTQQQISNAGKRGAFSGLPAPPASQSSPDQFNMTLYIESKPASRMDGQNNNILTATNTSDSFNHSHESSLQHTESSNDRVQSAVNIKLEPISAQIRRARRNCLTRIPSSRANDSLLPPLALSSNSTNTGGRVSTPTRERVLKILSGAPEYFQKNSLVAEPIYCDKVDRNITTPPDFTHNQDPEDHINNNTPIRNEVACRGPAKRRIRSSYGVRLDTIRVGIELEQCEENDTRRSHSNDEYQPNRKDGIKLAPLTLIHPDHL